MRSFAPALFAAALATIAGAVPVNLPNSVSSVSLPPTRVSSTVLPTKTAVGQVNSAAGKAKSLAGVARSLNGVVDEVKHKLSGVHARDTTPSVAVIFGDLSSETGPYVQELSYVDHDNASVAHITEVVASITGPIHAAVPRLQGLVGAEVNVILAPADATAGHAELTVGELAAVVGGEVNAVLGAAGKVIALVNAGVIEADVEAALGPLGDSVTDLIEAAVHLDEGLLVVLLPVLAPVVDVIIELHLDVLIQLLGIH